MYYHIETYKLCRLKWQNWSKVDIQRTWKYFLFKYLFIVIGFSCEIGLYILLSYKSVLSTIFIRAECYKKIFLQCWRCKTRKIDDSSYEACVRESESFQNIIVLIGYNSIVIRWENPFRKMLYRIWRAILWGKSKFMLQNLTEMFAKYWKRHLLYHTR